MDKRQYFACFNYRHKDMELIKRLQHEYKYYELTATLFEEKKKKKKKDLQESFGPCFKGRGWVNCKYSRYLQEI